MPSEDYYLTCKRTTYEGCFLQKIIFVCVPSDLDEVRSDSQKGGPTNERMNSEQFSSSGPF